MLQSEYFFRNYGSHQCDGCRIKYRKEWELCEEGNENEITSPTSQQDQDCFVILRFPNIVDKVKRYEIETNFF